MTCLVVDVRVCQTSRERLSIVVVFPDSILSVSQFETFYVSLLSKVLDGKVKLTNAETIASVLVG